MEKGYLCLVLHAHLPYVRHPEFEEFLEEDWLYEAITETYLPLLGMMRKLREDGVHFRLTMTLSPTLVSMMRDELLVGRYKKHLSALLELAAKEVERTKTADPRFHRLALFYRERFGNCRRLFEDACRCDLAAGFKDLQDSGCLDIMTCGATHAFLPLMSMFPQAVRAQVAVAARHYKSVFGRDPAGIWLPECAYYPGVEKFLREAGIKYFILEAHGMLNSTPRPRYGVFAPIYCPNGVAAFGRDVESSKQVWSANEGYPGDFWYREFYRDIGYDLDFEYVKKYIQPTGARKNTGIKYYRITGPTPHKQIYDLEAARENSARHAGHFMFCREKQIEHLFGVMRKPPIVVAPYDAELFGHWWFEGPQFLDFLIRKTAFDQKVFKLVNPAEYLARFPTNQVCQPTFSSWGYKGFAEVWLDGSNDWIYRHLHMAAKRMIELARSFEERGTLKSRALNQAARELLLAQSSDWAFIMKTGTMIDYAVRRTKSHVSRFLRLHDQIRSGSIDETWLKHVESVDNVFPEIDYRVYR